ncbi:hypothetical protein LEMLEM_LOCUS14985 [Lemmus lemmus]
MLMHVLMLQYQLTHLLYNEYKFLLLWAATMSMLLLKPSKWFLKFLALVMTWILNLSWHVSCS